MSVRLERFAAHCRLFLGPFRHYDIEEVTKTYNIAITRCYQEELPRKREEKLQISPSTCRIVDDLNRFSSN